ncbi:MAG: peptide chain release factor 2 [bacterium]
MNQSDARERLNEIRQELQELGDYLDLTELREKHDELQGQMAEPGFWDNHQEARKVSKEADRVKTILETYEDLETSLDDLEAMIELAGESDDGNFEEELEQGLRTAEKKLQSLQIQHFLSGEYDNRHAILSVNPGAGGTEAHDWAEMLFRMYRRWCEDHEHPYEILDYTPADEAGIKSGTLQVKADNAYGFLKGESGVHRLVRISPFDANQRRHTSFAAVQVTPEIEIDDEVDIEENELRIDTFKASGPGGQHVNTSDSAVRITHEPTGIVVSCQNERSQHANRDMAMKILRSRLLEQKIQEQKENIEDLKGDQKKIEWGSQIRSYINHPYQKVKDHRLDFEINEFESILDGNLDPFMEAYLSSEENQSSE